MPASNPESDLEVICSVLAGAHDDFAVLVRRYNNTLFRVCRSVLRDDAEAEDALQSTWLSAYRALASFRGDATFRTWLTRIALHESSSRARATTWRPEMYVDGMAVATAVGPEQTAFTVELGHLLERAIDALPASLRVVVVLRDVLGLDTAETAACVGIAEPAVRVRLHRAREVLRKRIDADHLGETFGTVWSFDGERCVRVQKFVMREITR
jgi:RNA polymerase sigma-70 factor, ECF subfamily